MAAPKPLPPPFLPPPYEVADVTAIQALVAGRAEPHQQQRAINWIINAAAATYDFDYRTDARDHAFGSGRRFVGLQLVKMLKLNVAALSKAEKRRQGSEE